MVWLSMYGFHTNKTFLGDNMDAKMARKMVAEHKGRQDTIHKLIVETNKSVEYACKRGERNAILSDKATNYGERYVEVHEHFRKKGFNIKIYSDGSGYYLTW